MNALKLCGYIMLGYVIGFVTSKLVSAPKDDKPEVKYNQEPKQNWNVN